MQLIDQSAVNILQWQHLLLEAPFFLDHFRAEAIISAQKNPFIAPNSLLVMVSRHADHSSSIEQRKRTTQIKLLT
jgi:hypothetical protein